MRTLLKNYPLDKVQGFESYLKQLETEKDKGGNSKNWWYKNITKEEFANVFKRVASKGLYIDGDSVSLAYRKKLVINFDYHAYKNKVLITYPESTFDFGLVYQGDKYTFAKESGKVIYSHKMADPFNTNKVLIGAYGIIRNSKGEFIELLTISDIEKMKNTSMMKSIWDTWFDRMVLKSVIKRICNVYFHDITKDIDEEDNEQNEPANATIPDLIQAKIIAAETEEDLTYIYHTYKGDVEDQEAFVNMLSVRKKEILG